MKMKRKVLIAGGLVFLPLVALLLFLLDGAGFFRSVDEPFTGERVAEISLPGPEDLAISWADSFALVSATERKKYPPEEEEAGDIYLLNLKAGAQFSVLNLTVGLSIPFAPHGISLFKMDSTYTVKVINHTPDGHSVEEFVLYDRDSLVHVGTLRDRSMTAPNDLVQVDSDRFYFTNDRFHQQGFGLFLEEFLGIGYSNVIYFDGTTYREVAGGVAFANGITWDRDRNRLFVAASRSFRIHAYAVQPDGSLTQLQEIPCEMGVDNIEIDREGNLWAAGHPNLMVYQEYAQRQRATSPSEVVKITQGPGEAFYRHSVYLEDGSWISGSTVAAPFGALILIGSALDDQLVVVQQPNQ